LPGQWPDRHRPRPVGAAELVDPLQWPGRVCRHGPAVRRRMADKTTRARTPMNWIDLEHLLRPLDAPRQVTQAPALDHAALCQQALCLAGGLRQRGVQRLAVHLEDAAQLAVALLGAWRAGVEVLL